MKKITKYGSVKQITEITECDGDTLQTDTFEVKLPMENLTTEDFDLVEMWNVKDFDYANLDWEKGLFTLKYNCPQQISVFNTLDGETMRSESFQVSIPLKTLVPYARDLLREWCVEEFDNNRIDSGKEEIILVYETFHFLPRPEH